MIFARCSCSYFVDLLMAGNRRELPEIIVPSFLFLFGELCAFKHHSHHQNVIISNLEMVPKRALVSNINSQVGCSQILPAQVLSQHARCFLSSHILRKNGRMFFFSFQGVMKPFAPRKKQSEGSRNVLYNIRMKQYMRII